MKTGQRGIDLIKEFEGCELKAYRCSAGVLSIGYGHTGPDVEEGMTISEDRAELLLRDDLAWAEECVNKHVNLTIEQYQFDALVSLVFNIGCLAFSKSTLLKLINAYQFEAAALQFPRWNKAGGRELAGLTRRRLAEKELFA